MAELRREALQLQALAELELCHSRNADRALRGRLNQRRQFCLRRSGVSSDLQC